MQNKLFIARTKGALKSRAEISQLDLNNYVIFSITDKARENETLKSLAQGITNPEYKYLMVHKSFVVITTDGKVNLNTASLAENSYAQDLNTPEVEIPGDKIVEDGVLKSVTAKIAQLKGLTDEEREVIAKALKSWGEHAGEEVTTEEEFVDELDTAEAKSTAAEDEKEGAEEAETEDADEKEEFFVSKSIRDRIDGLNSQTVTARLISTAKSFGSLADDALVFPSKGQAQRFAQNFNNKASGVTRASVAGADRVVRERFGTRAKFMVVIEN